MPVTNTDGQITLTNLPINSPQHLSTSLTQTKPFYRDKILLPFVSAEFTSVSPVLCDSLSPLTNIVHASPVLLVHICVHVCNYLCATGSRVWICVSTSQSRHNSPMMHGSFVMSFSNHANPLFHFLLSFLSLFIVRES